MKTTMIKEIGIIGRQKAVKAVAKGGEAIYRPTKNSFARALNMGGATTISDIPGGYWATAKLTIAKWYARYAD